VGKILLLKSEEGECEKIDDEKKKEVPVWRGFDSIIGTPRYSQLVL
jgi:hypothetical protein